MAKVELAIVIAGKVADRREIPARKAKVLLADIAPDASTNADRGKALTGHIVRRMREDLQDEPVQIGSRQCDVMQAELDAAGDTWDTTRIKKEGTDAFEQAYDAL